MKWISNPQNFHCNHQMSFNMNIMSYKKNAKNLARLTPEVPQHEKCPNTVLYLVRISYIQSEYDHKKTPYLDFFHAVCIQNPELHPRYFTRFWTRIHTHTQKNYQFNLKYEFQLNKRFIKVRLSPSKKVGLFCFHEKFNQ